MTGCRNPKNRFVSAKGGSLLAAIVLLLVFVGAALTPMDGAAGNSGQGDTAALLSADTWLDLASPSSEPDEEGVAVPFWDLRSAFAVEPNGSAPDAIVRPTPFLYYDSQAPPFSAA